MSECAKTKEKTVAWLNGMLDETALSLLENHCAACPACAEHLAVARRLKQALEDTVARHPAIPPSLEERIHLTLTAAASHQRKTGWMGHLRLFRPAFAVAVVLICVATIVGMIVMNQPSADTNAEKGSLVSRAEVKAGEPITIEVAYDAVHPLQQVDVTIELGEGISFFSGIPAIVSEKRLRWSGPFSEGRNTIPFVVTVERPGTWRISTTASYEGYRHRHRIVLSADEYKVVVTQYHFPPEELDEAIP